MFWYIPYAAIYILDYLDLSFFYSRHILIYWNSEKCTSSEERQVKAITQVWLVFIINTCDDKTVMLLPMSVLQQTD